MRLDQLRREQVDRVWLFQQSTMFFSRSASWVANRLNSSRFFSTSVFLKGRSTVVAFREGLCFNTSTAIE
jgi:hypothetical protein